VRGGVPRYVAQTTPQFDTEIAEKSHLWMETREDGTRLWFSHRSVRDMIPALVEA
jgi:hypothetical protein